MIGHTGEKKSHDVPPEARKWECHVCHKGLVSLPRHSHDSSIREHFAKEHPEVTPTEAYRQKQKEDVALRHRMSQRGAHVGQVKFQRLIDNLSTWAPDTDYTLSYVVFKDAPPGGFYRQQNWFSRLCCATCRKINPPTRFQKYGCSDRKQDVSKTVKTFLNKFTGVSAANDDAAAKAFQLTESEQEKVLGRRPQVTEAQDPHTAVRVGEAAPLDQGLDDPIRGIFLFGHAIRPGPLVQVAV